MIRFRFLLLAIVASGCEAPESTVNTPCSNIAQMYGQWDVSLLFDSSKPPSKTTLSLNGDGNSVDKGSFYGSTFESSELTKIPGYFVFSAQTSDGTGAYIHMARYNCTNHMIEGQTWSRGREFLMTWTAEPSDG